ncbi:GNAT family N-acetyltransferase [Bryobacter aggregatus]|uniref:GNAT family N-acetyltransferase n=1 Tax=Bryobacter aggregatus TaxID=360054 RepID=UPI0006918677|nr:GNAT family N-acetyltransferase [Bryobacter aggregatus]
MCWIRPFADGIAELKRLFVSPTVRGSGLSRRLLLQAVEEARRRSYRDTIVMKMPSAMALYRALGFEEVATVGGKTRPDLVDMELDLWAFPPVDGKAD